MEEHAWGQRGRAAVAGAGGRKPLSLSDQSSSGGIPHGVALARSPIGTGSDGVPKRASWGTPGCCHRPGRAMGGRAPPGELGEAVSVLDHDGDRGRIAHQGQQPPTSPVPLSADLPPHLTDRTPVPGGPGAPPRPRRSTSAAGSVKRPRASTAALPAVVLRRSRDRPADPRCRERRLSGLGPAKGCESPGLVHDRSMASRPLAAPLGGRRDVAAMEPWRRMREDQVEEQPG